MRLKTLYLFLADGSLETDPHHAQPAELLPMEARMAVEMMMTMMIVMVVVEDVVPTISLSDASLIVVLPLRLQCSRCHRLHLGLDDHMALRADVPTVISMLRRANAICAPD